MSDSDTGSDNSDHSDHSNHKDVENNEGHNSDSTPSHRSDTPSHRSNTPSHRSNQDENSQDLPSEKGSNKSDSERSSATPPNRNRKSLVNDSSEDEGTRSEAEEATAARIFGDDVSSSDSDDERGDAIKKRKQDNDTDGNQSDASRKSEESIHGIRMYPDQEEEQEKELPPTIIEASMSKVDCDFGDGIQFMKIPNFFSIALKPFDPETYEEDEDDDQVDEEGRNRLKLKAENTIRWRFAHDADGNIIKESNAKIIRWSDGSMSMVIGKERFDVESVPITGNMQHLFVRQGTGLVAQRIFDRKLIFRPHSTDSETHKKVTMSMAERTRKSAQVRMVAEVGANPEQARREAVRREEEAFRAALRKETQQRRTKDRHRPNAAYLEGRPDYSDDEEHTPRPRGRGFDAPLIGASDSEDSDIGHRGNERDAEDSDEEFRRKKQQQKKKIVTSDEESD